MATKTEQEKAIAVRSRKSRAASYATPMRATSLMAIVTACIAMLLLPFLASAQDIAQPVSGSGSGRMEYVSDRNYLETVQHLQWALGGSGITVVHALDFQAALKKMRVQTDHAAIFEIMRREWATTLLEEDRSLASILPLRIYVFEDVNGKVWLTYDRPARTLDMHSNEKLRAFGQLLEKKMASVALQATVSR